MQVDHVGGDEQVRRAVLAFAFQPFQQLGGVGRQQVDGDSGFCGKGVQHRFQQMVLAGGIDVDLGRRGRRGRRGGHAGDGGQGETIEPAHRDFSMSMRVNCK